MYCTVLYCTVLYCTVLYLTVLYSTVLYYRAKLQYKLLSQILCWRVEEAVQAVEEPKTLRFSLIVFCARYRPKGFWALGTKMALFSHHDEVLQNGTATRHIIIYMKRIRSSYTDPTLFLFSLYMPC